jgi:sporulation protein YlmC with PRC-barrel domain
MQVKFMLRIKKMSEVMGRHVYTSDGDYFGQIEDVNLLDNKIDGWKIKLSGGVISLLGGAKGAIIPQQFVKAIGDIFIINRSSIPAREEAELDLSEAESFN